MKERGMIFNGEMVRAILDGRKTQTRRIVKPQPELTKSSGFSWKGAVFGSGSDDRETNRNFAHVKCPHGKPGDRIWVRETFQGPLFDFDQMDAYCKDSAPFEKAQFCVYKADGKPAPEFFDADDNLHCCWRPSIHMPRWASRILLEIIDIRVERLNTISQADAIAEGAPPSHPSIDSVSREYGFPDFSRSWFGQTWQHIYGEESWQANPWVWVLEFKRINGGTE
ncbi:morphogenetic protein [Citrobacter sp. Cf140]|uniref:morphogenetic protein n=1 Tax=Citrobacter TaxID=544 RepID=UPI001A2F7C5A|nr:morphogenetic protein [Citrobacter sp. Cf140]MEB1122470.1 morphogenetic protein [Citrobacter freundii]MDM3100045.1 morphogenetic protein [Citrobacter sp. Cf140]HAU5660028.1 morphogenetic protein [Citrobacter freundii]HBV7900262.1 morphogenetic protein [Citrobacter freundii]HCB2471313.1 morphogenetic protein [Citrobacter freundii]